MIKISSVLAPAFQSVHKSIREEEYTNFWLKGGRGSCKSSTPSIEIVFGIMKDSRANSVALMKTGRHIETGIFNQLLWAIEKLGVSDYWETNKTQMVLKYYTGQQIFCRGCDDPKKIKSIKLSDPNGYFKYQWFEECDLFDGMEEIRNITQSLTRAGLDNAIRFYTYNPPRTIDHWINRHILDLESLISSGKIKDTLIHHSTYLDVSPEWLGKQFLQDAESLKITNIKAYEHEYIGEIVGTGGQVFINAEAVANCDIADKIGYLRYGLDWGFAVDPVSIIVASYDRAKKDLYIIDEYYAVGASFETVSLELKEKNKNNLLIKADSAEPRSNSELVKRGHNVTPVIKGADSVEHGIKWLQGLNHIYIAKDKCPNTLREFIGYEYERDRAGNFKASYPDKNNHAIDAVRYAMETEIRDVQVAKIQIRR